MAVKYLDERTFATGDVVFAEGDTSTEMFIVQEGKVALTRTVAGREIFIGTLERGDFFGEMSMLTGRPRHATCVAIAPATLLAIRSGELLIKLRRDPTLALEMVAQMSRRMAYLEDQLVKLSEHQLESREALDKVMAKAEFHRDDGDA
jgi:CRP/FNR family transcriptional regulator/CRP/FNR family cyclic AMP-dependent transcriptional regulator